LLLLGPEEWEFDSSREADDGQAVRNDAALDSFHSLANSSLMPCSRKISLTLVPLSA